MAQIATSFAILTAKSVNNSKLFGHFMNIAYLCNKQLLKPRDNYEKTFAAHHAISILHNWLWPGCQR
jgi:hypothetical protein